MELHAVGDGDDERTLILAGPGRGNRRNEFDTRAGVIAEEISPDKRIEDRIADAVAHIADGVDRLEADRQALHGNPQLRTDRVLGEGSGRKQRNGTYGRCSCQEMATGNVRHCHKSCIEL